MELERLAEELAVREQGSLRLSVEHDLPAYIPLSHDNPYLSAETFNVEEFLLSRAYTSLPDLRSELRDYLATLKEELVKLINDDYEAFISLSTDLRGEGARLERLKGPLAGLKGQVLVCTCSVHHGDVFCNTWSQYRSLVGNCRTYRMQYRESCINALNCERRRYVEDCEKQYVPM